MTPNDNEDDDENDGKDDDGEDDDDADDDVDDGQSPKRTVVRHQKLPACLIALFPAHQN